MSSVQALREFINQRLTAAAGEIFTVFQQTIVQFEEEIYQQRRLLEINWSPQIKLRGTELQQHHDCREEQLFRQETNYCGEQEEPEPSQIKEEPEEPELLQIKEEPGVLQFKEDQEEPEPPQTEEHEELGTSQEGEQLILKFESGVKSIDEEHFLSEAEEAPDTEQFLSQDSKDHNVKKHVDSESTMNVELKKIRFHSEHVENFPVSEKQAECEERLCEETCGEIVLKKHRLSHKINFCDKKICEICGKSFNRQGNLLVHMRTHTCEKPYCCETCGKSFSQQNNLLRHKRTHTGEKPYSCETCGKSFSQQNLLLRHMRIHTSDKPYSCETCGKSFSQRNHLLAHKRTHTGEKPYSCETCGKNFSQRGTLLIHMRSHTGEKPYPCDTCAMRFTYRRSLVHHMKSHKQKKS